MIFLLPLIILAAANSCPYCRWNQCTLTEGGIASCGECYSMAARLNMQVPSSGSSQAVQNIGVCQLCPDHCNSCEYALQSPAMSTPVHSINCTSCHYGYVNSYFNGSCVACTQHCASCMCIFNSCMATQCQECEEGYDRVFDRDALDYLCVPSEGRRLIETQPENGQENQENGQKSQIHIGSLNN